MAPNRRHAERHRSDRIGWLRAAVLGANDGIVSTASLVLGVVAAGADHRTVLQAALASAVSFSVGAVLPIGVVLVAPQLHLIWWVALSSLAFLAGLGASSAQIGGAPMGRGTWRVTFWGAIAMAVTAGAGAVFGAVT
jgi:VIT1/CCC1 family predicted Fe2+/Mn2+ transporter